MTSQTLREARIYEEACGKTIREEERPAFHLTPRIGWMNDPNGFSYYNGQYHMFYQYHPYDTKWGPMYWGHAVSRDLLRWEYLPAALAPDEVYDRNGCFSGSAVGLADGRQLLMYTGVRHIPWRDGGYSEIQTQCLAVGGGVDYEKYEGNPVIDGEDLPEGFSRTDFRDPKVWKRSDGTYLCILGNRPADGSGQILLFSSGDGFRWKYEKVFAENRNRYGRMWECPDFFELDGRGVLLVSPQDMLPQDLEFHNGNGTLCIIGGFDENTYTFTEETHRSIDYGIDFYAPQTICSPDGRRIMIGWMQNWDCCFPYAPDQKWFGQMSLPRELSVRNGRLYQKPVKELEDMRKNQTSHSDVIVENGRVQLEGICGRKADIELVIRPADPESKYHKFAVHFAENEQYHTSVSFRPDESVLKIDRKFSGFRKGAIHQRRCEVSRQHGELKLRIILDRYSAEVFINDGEQVMSAVFYTDLKADGISFLADGKVKMDVVKYDL